MGRVLSDYANMSMEFTWKGNRVTWVGEPIPSNDPFSMNELKSLVATSTSDFFCKLVLVGNEPSPIEISNTIHEALPLELLKLLEKYCEIFSKVVELSP